MDLLCRYLKAAVNLSLQDPSALTKIRRRLLVPVRFIVKLERWRGNRLADWLRRRIIAAQPGLESLPSGLLSDQDFVLWIPPSWYLNRADYRRLDRLLRIRQARSNAQVVSCDDWVSSRNGDILRWREKGQLDCYLDARTGFFDGPLLLAKSLIDEHDVPPDDPALRPQWRSTLAKNIDFSQWSHVSLPLAVCPHFSHEPAQPNKPNNRELISLLIPSGGFLKPVNGRDTMLFRHCLTTLLQRSDYRNIEIILVDGGEFSEQQILEFQRLVESSLGPNRWIHCRDNRPYSYSLRMNLAASVASGKYFLQLNDDTELLEPKALDSMVALLEQPGIGVVGSLLLYPGGRVQHAGVAIDNLAPSHPWAGFWPKRLPVGLLASPRQFQSVTAAVCMCSSDLWNSLNGIREDLPVNYGDVDFCLRARELGWSVMLDPASRWTHFESASRSLDKVPVELPRFRELWSEKLGGYRCIDPYSSRWRELRRPV